MTPMGVFFAPYLPLPRYHLGRTVPSFDPPFALANAAEVVMDENLNALLEEGVAMANPRCSGAP